jgi:hypothetical protein
MVFLVSVDLIIYVLVGRREGVYISRSSRAGINELFHMTLFLEATEGNGEDIGVVWNRGSTFTTRGPRKHNMLDAARGSFASKTTTEAVVFLLG